jgi:hypothetical protein
MMCAVIEVAVVLMSLGSILADLDLQDVHPDETAEETYNQRFSFGNAIQSLQRVRTASKTPDTMSVEERTIGYRNWLGVLEGTLRKQQLILSQLTYELAVERHGKGEASAEDVEKSKDALEEQRRSFLQFWEQFGIAD